MSRESPVDPPSAAEGDFFASFVEECSDPVLSVDGDGVVVYANPAVESALGYDPPALRGRRLAELIPEDPDDERVRSLRRRLSSDADPSEAGSFACPLRRADGSTVAFSVRFHEHQSSGEPVYTGVFRDGVEEATARDLRTFRNLIEHSGHAVYVTDPSGTIEYVNPAFTDNTGYEPGDAIGETPAILSSGEVSDEYFAALWETIESGEVWQEDIVDRRRDGEPNHVHQTIAPVFDEDGGVSRFVAIQTDVTENQEAAGRLKQYREIVEAIDDPILLQNLDGEFELLNEAVSEFAGVPREELYGTDEFAFMDPETAAEIADRRREVIETEEPVAYETSPTLERSGREAAFSTRRYPHYDPDGELAGTFAVCRDVTEIKRREAELERYERAVNGATDLIAAVDREGGFLFANPQYRAYHGIEADDVRDLSISDVVGDDRFSDVKRHVDRALQGEAVEYRTKRTHPDRGMRTFDVRYYPLEDPDGDEIAGVVGVLRDVTDSENRARQLSVVDRVLQHNLRNALTVIRGRAREVAEATSDGDGTDQDSDADAAEAASYIVSRADDLLTTSEKAHHITEILSDVPEVEPMDVGRAVDELVESLAADYPHADISVSTPANGEAVASATAWLDRALSELVRNAIVHHDGAQPTVDVAVEGAADEIEVRIADDGPGLNDMDRDVLETGRAVDALYHGSGLGLWLVYWVLQQSGGSAAVEDADPRGTVVTVTLARATE
ncbi:PAS domain S-box protein [Halorubrum yunnanense]|uniref:PAS domain S-box protein n=1 Tax=Halorubrum yunnanense TaxID=1526162 RepID=A0ABD5Y8L5_9EURY|nr:PAS domain S-box protein [Halorubrum yunnanense]